MIYIFIILLCRVAQHLCSKRASGEVDTLYGFFGYSAYKNFLSAVLGASLIIIAGNGLKLDAKTLLISTFSGLMLGTSSCLGLAALKGGTVALSSMFGTAGLLVPCFAGIFLFDKPMSIGQWIGILMFFVAAYFLISSSSEIYNGFSLKTFFILVGVMFAEGFTMLSQQLFAEYVPDGDVSVFSLFSFGIAALISVIFTLIFGMKESSNAEKKSPLSKRLLALGFVLAVAVFIINQLATIAAKTVSPVVLFTFINGGSTIIGSVIAALCFKEKFSVKSVFGILLGVASLIIIKAF